jgi:2-C-methyl-D-erythritol 4-phosphate cytidylyltransferase
MFQGKKISAIINCAGTSNRFGKNKLIQTLGGHKNTASEMVIVQTIKNFLQPEIDEIIVTTNKKNLSLYRQILITEKKLPITLVLGGAERYLSTLNGLRASDADYVLIHDGVRPFVTANLINKLLVNLKQTKATILATMTTTTIKTIDPNLMTIKKSLPRQKSWLAQTPQLFERLLLLNCYQQALKENYQIVSDDSELITKYSCEKVKIITGDEHNIKITYPQDIKLANLIYQEWQEKIN